MEDKTIEVMSFMNTNANSDFAQKMATKLVIHEKQNNLSVEERRIFEENSDRERHERLRNSVKKQKTIGKIKFYAGLAIIAVGATLVLKREIDKRMQPITIVKEELTIDANVWDMGDGKTPDEKFKTTEKLLKFIDQHNLTREEIDQAIENFATNSSPSLDLEFVADKIRATNPGVISEELGKPDLNTNHTRK